MFAAAHSTMTAKMGPRLLDNVKPGNKRTEPRKFAWAVSHCPLPVPMFKVATFFDRTAAWLVTRST